MSKFIVPVSKHLPWSSMSDARLCQYWRRGCTHEGFITAIMDRVASGDIYIMTDRDAAEVPWLFHYWPFRLLWEQGCNVIFPRKPGKVGAVRWGGGVVPSRSTKYSRL